LADGAVDQVLCRLLDEIKDNGSLPEANVFVASRRRPPAPRLPAAEGSANHTRIASINGGDGGVTAFHREMIVHYKLGGLGIAGDLNGFVAACEQEPAEQGRNRDQGGFPEAHRPMRHESVLRTDTIITVTLSNTADGKELRIKPGFTRWLSPAVESNLWAGKRSAKTWDAGWRTRKPRRNRHPPCPPRALLGRPRRRCFEGS